MNDDYLAVLTYLQELLTAYQNVLVAIQFFYLLALFLTHNTRFQLLGLTGGIASGKSTASAYIAAHHNLPVVDLDLLAAQLTAKRSAPLLAAIRREFGGGVFREKDGLLDREALGALVWGDAEKRRRLNALYRWPLLRATVAEIARVAWRRRGGEVVLDAPLLYESGLWRACRETVCVYTDAPTQLKRLTARDAIDEQSAREKVGAQMSLEEKRRRCDVLVDNSGSEEQLRAKIDEWLRWRQKERLPTWQTWMTPSLPCVVVSFLFWAPIWWCVLMSKQYMPTK